MPYMKSAIISKRPRQPHGKTATLILVTVKDQKLFQKVFMLIFHTKHSVDIE